VHTLTLLEPALFTVPSADAFLKNAGPSLEAYGAGDHERAVAGFLSAVSGLDWETCQAVIDQHVPGGIAQTVKDADTLFGIELPAISAWAFGPRQAAAMLQPVLSVLGTETVQLFVEGQPLLHSWFPQVEDCTIEGVGHLLHIPASPTRRSSHGRIPGLEPDDRHLTPGPILGASTAAVDRGFTQPARSSADVIGLALTRLKEQLPEGDLRAELVAHVLKEVEHYPGRANRGPPRSPASPHRS
jgi:hypothetical protein